MNDQSLNGIKIKLISASRIFGSAMTNAGSTSPYWQGYEDLQKALTELDDFIRQHATAPDLDTLAPIILQGRENHESCTITAKKIIRAIGDASARKDEGGMVENSDICAAPSSAKKTSPVISSEISDIEVDFKQFIDGEFHRLEDSTDTWHNDTDTQVFIGNILAFIRPHLRSTSPIVTDDTSLVKELKPCPYANGFSSNNTEVNFILKRYENYSDFVLFEDGNPERCFRFAQRKPVSIAELVNDPNLEFADPYCPMNKYAAETIKNVLKAARVPYVD